jgi:hypothetical protein
VIDHFALADLEAFLRWNSGPLLEFRNRNAYAEWLVHRALGLDPGAHRSEGSLLVVDNNGFCLTVKSAAYVQSRQQEATCAISFPIDQRSCSAYVFCLLNEDNPDLANPTQNEQWLFWVVPTAKLHAERRSIGLQALLRAYGDGINYRKLASAIHTLR